MGLGIPLIGILPYLAHEQTHNKAYDPLPGKG